MSLVASLAASVQTGVAAIAPAVASTDNPVADFSDTPWWLSLVKALMVFVFLLVNVVVVIWFERRVVARMQQRPGPNRAGPFGLLQTVADGIKLVLQEDVIPARADKSVFLLAPIIAGTMAFVSFAIIPMGPMISMFGHRTPLQLTDTPVAVLLVLAVAGVGAYGSVLAGWSSGSTYPLLGGLRATAQVISYEIGMGLALVAVILYSGSMSTSQIVASQKSMWYIIPAFFSFLVYVVTMVGETNRLPFDLAEGEGELTGGFHTEYSSMRFAMFFLGEYINMFTVSALATTMFLGGWQAPPGIAAINDGMFNEGWWGLLWFVIKLWLFMFFFVWLRGTLPRVRYDQFMRFGWKFLIPVTLFWVVAVAFIHGAQLAFFGANTRTATIIVVGVISALALAVAWVWEGSKSAASVPVERPEEIDPFAGGYPIPPLPGQRLREPSLQGARPPVGTAAPAGAADSPSHPGPTDQEDTRG